MNLAGPGNLKKVVVLNPKGGSGKTTLAFSIAGFLACTGRRVALLDMDRQGSSQRWLQNRSPELPAIQLLLAPADPAATINVPSDIDVVVIDAPAALQAEDLADYTCGMHAILVPVLPSDIDIHAASRLVSDLLLKAQVSRRNGRLGIVANRIKERTIAYRRLMRFLESLSIKLIGVLRDSQNYTHAAAEGRCLHEMAASQVKRDKEQWKAITEWLEDRLAMPLTPRDMLRPAAASRPKRRLAAVVLPAAAMIAGVAIVAGLIGRSDEPSADVSPAMPAAATTMAAATAPADEPDSVTAAAPVSTEPDTPDPVTTLAAAPPPEAEEPDARWRLTGVVQSGDARVLMLSDENNDTTVNLNIDDEIDGWSVADSGSDYAVLRQDGREVRLALQDPIESSGR